MEQVRLEFIQPELNFSIRNEINKKQKGSQGFMNVQGLEGAKCKMQNAKKEKTQ